MLRMRMSATLSAKLRPWLDGALSFVYPEICQLCEGQRAKPQNGYVCEACWTQVRFVVPPFCERCGLPFEGEINGAFECTNCREMDLHFVAARSSVAARGPVLEAIHRYKYDRHLWFEEFLVELLLIRARAWFAQEKCDAIVPVPLFPVKQRERGFNQAERLSPSRGRGERASGERTAQTHAVDAEPNAPVARPAGREHAECICAQSRREPEGRAFRFG